MLDRGTAPHFPYKNQRPYLSWRDQSRITMEQWCKRLTPAQSGFVYVGVVPVPVSVYPCWHQASARAPCGTVSSPKGQCATARLCQPSLPWAVQPGLRGWREQPWLCKKNNRGSPWVRNLVFPVSGEYLKSLGFAFHLGGEGGGGAKKKRIFNHLKTDTSNSTNTGLEHSQDNVIYALWPHCTKQVDGQGHGTSPCKLSLSINRKP